MHYIGYIIATLYALSLGGIVYILMQVFESGADAYAQTYSEDTSHQFEDIFLFIPSRRITEAAIACFGATFILTFLLALPRCKSFNAILIAAVICALLSCFALLIPKKVLKVLRDRRREKINEQLVDTLLSMSNGLKAGFSISQVFENISKNGEAPISQEFDLFVQQTRLGVSFSEALKNMEDRVQSQDMTLLALAIETARKTGGNLTDVMENIAHTIRERIRIQGRIKTLTAQGRMQGIIVSLMPIAIFIIIFNMQPEIMGAFVYSLPGLIIMSVVVVLIITGGLVIRKIIDIDI
ncbi:MAG: type II secretion system F family protein [Kiritimatiellae bacterium]|jgi:tight adherence protein B|nr:type II secretion system F family protein [Kiritimatiellia bacterium]